MAELTESGKKRSRYYRFLTKAWGGDGYNPNVALFSEASASDRRKKGLSTQDLQTLYTITQLALVAGVELASLYADDGILTKHVLPRGKRKQWTTNCLNRAVIEMKEKYSQYLANGLVKDKDGVLAKYSEAKVTETDDNSHVTSANQTVYVASATHRSSSVMSTSASSSDSSSPSVPITRSSARRRCRASIDSSGVVTSQHDEMSGETEWSPSPEGRPRTRRREDSVGQEFRRRTRMRTESSIQDDDPLTDNWDSLDSIMQQVRGGLTEIPDVTSHINDIERKLKDATHRKVQLEEELTQVEALRNVAAASIADTKTAIEKATARMEGLQTYINRVSSAACDETLLVPSADDTPGSDDDFMTRARQIQQDMKTAVSAVSSAAASSVESCMDAISDMENKRMLDEETLSHNSVLRAGIQLALDKVEDTILSLEDSLRVLQKSAKRRDTLLKMTELWNEAAVETD
ncbi:hypothetical protein QBC47DRAFT_409902 [Echria macrotheca]|uniref:Uncharacterized protein n=1 Tax=Echria macrotheca TaxID=438768 RepID=A0AAJ0BL58_9PEZI|nr:hypothetical protein QBC47DRAFT_409902 [Echria macrotheca]